MQRSVYVIFNILLFCVHYALLSSNGASVFRFTEEARAALCPFVGTEGLRCFDGAPLPRSGRDFDPEFTKLPRGVGISVDRSTGRLMAPAVQLTYVPTGTRTWTDGHSGTIFDLFNEATLSQPDRAVIAYDSARVHVFYNSSQLNAAWRQTFADGIVRGGALARRSEILEYSENYFSRGEALALAQRVIGLYTLRINVSTIQLNPFARRAIAQLTPTFNSDLYEDFLNTWGTHIITRSLVGGMTEEQATVPRCVRVSDDGRFTHCIPFSDRGPISSNCTYYSGQIRVISKRHLGGNVEINKDYEWRRTVAAGPALLQILEMVPWSNFITDNAVKQNLISTIRCRQRNFDFHQAESTRFADSRLQPCFSAPVCSAHINVNSIWKKNGVTVAGGNGAGGGMSQLNAPHSLFIDNDQTLYIADFANHRVVEWKVGVGWGGIAAVGNGQLNLPHEVIVDKARDSVFIADAGNKRLVRWSLRNPNNWETIISGVACSGLTMDVQGFLYVSDWERHEVRRWQVGEAQGIVVAGGNGAGNRLDQLNGPRKVFVDRDQSVYVSEWHNDRVMRWVRGAKEGIVVAGGRGRGNLLSQLHHPDGVIVDQSGTVYVADRFNHRIMRWPKGVTQGEILVGESGGGSLPSQLIEPIGLSFDRHGNLYVADSGNHRVQKFEIQ